MRLRRAARRYPDNWLLREIAGREAAYRAAGGRLLTPDLREVSP